jgi:hypothetical protein
VSSGVAKEVRSGKKEWRGAARTATRVEEEEEDWLEVVVEARRDISE